MALQTSELEIDGNTNKSDVLNKEGIIYYVGIVTDSFKVLCESLSSFTGFPPQAEWILYYIYKRRYIFTKKIGCGLSSPSTDINQENLSDVIVKRQSHNTPRRRLGERTYSSYSFSTSVLDGVSGQLHAPAALYPRERTPCIHCTGGWVGPRAGLDTEVRGRNSSFRNFR
jgi:hypothetical protein